MFYSASTGGFYSREIHGANMPPDSIEIGEEAHADLIKGQDQGKRIIPDEQGFPVLADPLPEVVMSRFVGEIQFRLDAWARTRGYDGILSACSYATSTVPKFSAEGQRAVQLRDDTWAAAYAVLAQVQSGAREVPNSLADLEAELPALEWPE